MTPPKICSLINVQWLLNYHNETIKIKFKATHLHFFFFLKKKEHYFLINSLRYHNLGINYFPLICTKDQSKGLFSIVLYHHFLGFIHLPFNLGQIFVWNASMPVE
ncbi:hypothetical protein EGW08_008330, partial [Elysia chlorotica]